MGYDDGYDKAMVEGIEKGRTEGIAIGRAEISSDIILEIFISKPYLRANWSFTGSPILNLIAENRFFL